MNVYILDTRLWILRYHEGGTEYQNVIPGVTIRAKMEFFAMDVLIPEGHKIKLSLRDIGEDYLPPSTEAAVDIDVSGSSVLRIHEINTDQKYSLNLLYVCMKIVYPNK